MISLRKKVLGLGLSIVSLISMVSAEYNGSYQNDGVALIGNLSHDFGVLFTSDMPDLVIGALILGLIIFLGVILRRIMDKATKGV